MKKLSKKLKITLNNTKNRKIPTTNNLVKLLFRVTFPGKIKRISGHTKEHKDKHD